MAGYSKMIRTFMPDQHRAFFEQLPFLVTASVDQDGWPWATLLVVRWASFPAFSLSLSLSLSHILLSIFPSHKRTPSLHCHARSFPFSTHARTQHTHAQHYLPAPLHNRDCPALHPRLIQRPSPWKPLRPCRIQFRAAGSLGALWVCWALSCTREDATA